MFISYNNSRKHFFFFFEMKASLPISNTLDIKLRIISENTPEFRILLKIVPQSEPVFSVTVVCHLWVLSYTSIYLFLLSRSKSVSTNMIRWKK